MGRLELGGVGDHRPGVDEKRRGHASDRHLLWGGNSTCLDVKMSALANWLHGRMGVLIITVGIAHDTTCRQRC
jgi:hypothetical protein